MERVRPAGDTESTALTARECHACHASATFAWQDDHAAVTIAFCDAHGYSAGRIAARYGCDVLRWVTRG